MSDSLLRKVLVKSISPKKDDTKTVLNKCKSIQQHRFETRIRQLEKQVEDLQDQLEESNAEINRLRAQLKEAPTFTLPVAAVRKDSDEKTQFRLSM